MGVTLPFALLLFDFWPLHRFDVGRDATGALRISGTPLRLLFAEKLPLLALALASSLVTVASQRGGSSVVPLSVIPLLSRAANAVNAAAAYLGKTLFPVSLAAFYPHPHYLGGLPAAQVFAAALVLCGVTLLALFWVRRRPYVATGWFLFLGMLVPVSGLVQVGGQAMADRYTYLPLIGVFVILSWGTADLAEAWRVSRFVPGALWGAAVLALAVLAHAQAATWRSDDALFAHALAVAPSWLVHTNFGEVLEARGEPEAAAGHYRAALRLAPGDAVARHHLADIFARAGRFDDALAELSAALRSAPDDGIARYKMGSILFNQGRLEAAIASFRAALRSLPDDTDVRSNLGVALLRHGDIDEASSQFRETLRRSPADPVALRSLREAIALRGARDAAAAAGR
jgi:tetratricopeptide (TPR) repeat protein